MTQMLPFYRFPSALLQINEPSRRSWSLTLTLPFPLALPPHDSPLRAFDVFLLARIYAQPTGRVILSENLAPVLPSSTLIVLQVALYNFFTPTFMLWDLSEELVCLARAHHPRLCMSSLLVTSDTALLGMWPGHVDVCATSLGFTRNNPWQSVGPQFKGASFLLYSPAAGQLPQTRDGDGLPAPDPRHRQTEQGGSREYLQVSTGRVVPRAPDSMAWLVASGPICPLLPHPEETKVPQSPPPWGTLQHLQQPP